MATTIACDFFTVSTVTIKNLFVFVVLHHGSRRILDGLHHVYLRVA
jgi:hypothetical protein